MQSRHRSYKFRLYPNKEQQAKIDLQMQACRFVYNYFLHKGQSGVYSMMRKLTQLKKEPAYSWLAKVSAVVLQQVLLDLQTAFDNNTKGTAYPPQYKSDKSFTQARFTGDSFHLKDNQIQLAKLGWINMKSYTELVGEPSSVSLLVVNGKVYVSIVVKIEIPETSKLYRETGIDLGLKHFAVLSSGEKIDLPDNLKSTHKKIRRIRKLLSKKRRGSHSQLVMRGQLRSLTERAMNQRNAFFHQLTGRLAREYSFIALESLNIRGMMANPYLRTAIKQAGWYSFIQQLKYKGDWYGCEVVQIGRYEPSSKVCSSCDYKLDKLDLGVRRWTCPVCGADHDRDINAAKNILRFAKVPYGLRELKPVESNNSENLEALWAGIGSDKYRTLLLE